MLLNMSIQRLTRSFPITQSLTSYGKFHTLFSRPHLINQIGSFVPRATFRFASSGSSGTIDLVQDASLLQSAAQTSTDLASIGLGGYTPPGLLQTILEALHTQGGLSWWSSIILSTIILRSLLFPLTVRSMRASQRALLVQPQLAEVQDAMKRATGCGDDMEAERMTMKYLAMLRKHDITPLKQFTNVIVQAPVFISFFMALRGMAKAPLASMTEGGLFWFSNLVIPDPYFILPASTSTTLLISLYVSESRSAMQASPIIKYGLIGFVVILFPIATQFPACLTLYWFTSNMFTTIVSLTITHERFAPYFGLRTNKEMRDIIASRPKGKTLKQNIMENLRSFKASSKYKAVQNERVKEIKLAEKEKTIKIVVPSEEIKASYKKYAGKTRPNF